MTTNGMPGRIIDLDEASDLGTTDWADVIWLVIQAGGSDAEGNRS